MYYCIECYLGNGKEKVYPSDHVSIYGENLNEVIKKFGQINKSACFECWEQVYLVKWIYSWGEHDPSEPIPIKFLHHFKIQIDGFGEFQLEKPEWVGYNDLISELKHKYKRCFALAMWCDAESCVSDSNGDYDAKRFFIKWLNRWLELYDKFKTEYNLATTHTEYEKK